MSFSLRQADLRSFIATGAQGTGAGLKCARSGSGKTRGRFNAWRKVSLEAARSCIFPCVGGSRKVPVARLMLPGNQNDARDNRGENGQEREKERDDKKPVPSG